MYEWINIIVLGALLGATGQAARSIVGWKKIFDEAREGAAVADIFKSSRLVVSMIIGAVAGMIAALMLVDDASAFVKAKAPAEFKQFLLALVASGYAGADFIEGFVRNSSLKGKADAETAEQRKDQTGDRRRPLTAGANG